MADLFMHTVLTPAVIEAEKRYYGRSYPTFPMEPPSEELGPSEIDFIQGRDSFYIATITENDWPYIQHRGGPSGFVRVLGPRRIGFADYGGNRQMITVGSISKKNRVSLFLMDYLRRQRLKLLGTAKVFDAREYPEFAGQVEPPSGHASKVERIFIIDLLSHDWNCPKFITPRFTVGEVNETVDFLKNRIKDLEAQLKETL